MSKTKKRILVIDDGLDGQRLLTVFLEASGYQIECTSNGEEALSLLRRSSDLPDLILLDGQMPIMNGYQFRVQQLLDVRFREIPTVVLTGDDDLAISEEMIDPLEVLHKPIQISQLVSDLPFYILNQRGLPQSGTEHTGAL